MKNIKENKGITLVALVITIIVMLILAGVTISMLFGENGLISRAQTAVNKWNEADQEEQEGLSNLEDIIDEAINNEIFNELAKIQAECIEDNNNYINWEGNIIEMYDSYEYDSLVYRIIDTSKLRTNIREKGNKKSILNCYCNGRYEYV